MATTGDTFCKCTKEIALSGQYHVPLAANAEGRGGGFSGPVCSGVVPALVRRRHRFSEGSESPHPAALLVVIMAWSSCNLRRCSFAGASLSDSAGVRWTRPAARLQPVQAAQTLLGKVRHPVPSLRLHPTPCPHRPAQLAILGSPHRCLYTPSGGASTAASLRYVMGLCLAGKAHGGSEGRMYTHHPLGA